MPVRSPLSDEADEIMMAPLLDCVFLLLIFFLVSSQMKKVEKELPVDLPDAAAAVNVKASADMLVIGIDAAGRFYLGAEPVSRETLRARLASAAGHRVRIDVDRAAPAQSLVHILDECHFNNLRPALNTRVENRRYYGD